ncbi:S-layer homology domain-containing protein [Marinicrinis lubricantis]|uniref:S-layer homology domain-containing protein n=1 Tax=Marinicrinis lubricantis TaxID=2086470 RepID=A0ABW1IN43_9BACL
MDRRFEFILQIFQCNLARNTLRIVTVATMLTVIGFGLDALEARAEPNVVVERVLDRIIPYDVATLVTNGEIFLCIGQTGDKYISEDGLNWTRSVNEIQVDNWDKQNYFGKRKIIWDGKQFVMATGDLVVSSTDGVNWKGTRIVYEGPEKDHYYEIQDIIWDSTKYILIAQDVPLLENGGFYVKGENAFYYSYDLKTWFSGTKEWMAKTVFGERSIENLIWNGHHYLAGGNQSAYSKDGIHWEGNDRSETSDSKDFNGSRGNGQRYIWDGSKFWLAYQNQIETSEDGSNWELVHTIDKDVVSLETIGYNGRAYLATGESKMGLIFYYSQDGEQWDQVKLDLEKPDKFSQVLPIKGGFLIAGQDIFYVSDVSWNTPSRWASKDLKLAEKNRLVPADLLRAYDSPITRSEFSKIAVRLYEALTGRESEPAAVNPFTDTSRKDVLKAYKLGIVQGRDEGIFAPDDPITRQDLAVMLYKTLIAAGFNASPISTWQKSYVDIGQVSGYAVEPLRFFNQAYILKGKEQDLLAPLDQTTREEAYVLAERIYDKYKSVIPTIEGQVKTGFDAIRGYLEDEGYTVLKEQQYISNSKGSEISTSYVVRNRERQDVLTYSQLKPDPEYVRDVSLLGSLVIKDYKPESDAYKLDLIQKVIEKDKGFEMPGLSEQLRQATIESEDLTSGNSKQKYIEVNEGKIFFSAFRGFANELIITIN